MPSVITSSFHNSVAESVMSEIANGTSRFYYYFGNTKPYTGDAETPIDSPEYIAKVRNSMITLLEINQADVSYVIPRVTWTSGHVYNKYESSTVGTPTNFYAMTDEYNVYKCLDNAAAGTPSTVKPTTTDISPIHTGDGYVWKFMFNVPVALRNKFMTSVYIPVSTGLKNRFYGSGEVDSIAITNSGTGYTQGTTSLVISGDGSGLVITPVISGGRLVSVTIVNPGKGYTFCDIVVTSTLTITDVAKVTALLSDGNINTQQAITENLSTPGTIDSISVVSSGTGYSTASSLTITGDGTGAVGTLSINAAGQITKVTITNPGKDYTFATATLGNIDNGAGAVLNANVSKPFGHGRNAVKELYANTLMFYGNMSTNRVAGFELDNDYRQFGVIKNIRSTTQDLAIPDANSFNKFTLYTTDAVTYYPTETTLTDNTLPIHNTYTVTATTTGTTRNAVEVTGSVEPAAIGLQYTGNGHTFTSVGMQSNPLVKTKSSTLCFIVYSTFNINTYPVDTILTKGSNSYIIVANGTGKLMIQPLDGGTINAGDTLRLDNVNSIVASSVTYPEADRRTGDILTIDNRDAFFQSPDQSVSTRTVIRF